MADIKPVFIGADFGREDSWVMARFLHDQERRVWTTIAMPPEMLRPSAESTANAIAALAREYAPKLDNFLHLGGRRSGKTSIIERLMGAPQRRKWDQYGSYHRRQMKKWRKRQPIINCRLDVRSAGK